MLTFPEMTKMMLTNMDFFELRRTAARYDVAFQGIRRQKLIRDLEIVICSKNEAKKKLKLKGKAKTTAAASPEGAMHIKPKATKIEKSVPRINSFSTKSNFLTR